MTLPNWLSLARLLAVPFVWWAIAAEAYGTALALFLIAALTDAADGYLARRLGQQSVLGSYVDPLADKALLVVAFVALAVQGLIPLWLAILAVGRDAVILIVVGASRLWTVPVALRPLWVSKANTVAQMVLVLLVLFLNAAGLAAPLLVSMLVGLVAVLTVVSAIGYVSVMLGRPASGRGNA